MKILVACEESQAVTIELRRLGHEAYSCDLLPCSGGHPEWHLQQDVLPLLHEKWDMIIAFPPCTYLSNAGARHLYRGVFSIKSDSPKGLKPRSFSWRFTMRIVRWWPSKTPHQAECTDCRKRRRLYSHGSLDIRTQNAPSYG